MMDVVPSKRHTTFERHAVPAGMGEVFFSTQVESSTQDVQNEPLTQNILNWLTTALAYAWYLLIPFTLVILLWK